MLTNAISSRPTRKEAFRTSAVLAIVISLLNLVVVGVMFKFIIDGQNYIQSCTNPSGECFKENAARTGSAVAGINLTAIFVAECSLAGATDIEKCVGEKLDERSSQITPGN